MAYGQKNYNQIQGRANPRTGAQPKYRINQIGCFLVAFCNLEERFGRQVDPLALNAAFRDRGIYVDVDDGFFDDLGWGSVSAFDPRIIVTGTGNGRPPVTNAIVKFRFVANNGLTNTHFCLVADVAKGLIVDSWDGVIKSWNVYGGPIAYATYAVNAPQPVPPASPPPAPASRFSDITPVELVVNKQPTHLWDLHATTWAFKAVEDWPQGKRFTAKAIYNHPLGGKYYCLSNGDMRGINVVDTNPAPPLPAPPAPTPPPAPAPASAPDIKYEVLATPRKMVISKPGGADKWGFGNAKTWAELVKSGTGHYAEGTPFEVVGIAHHPVPPTGATYYLDAQAMGDFVHTGRPAQTVGFNKVDLADAPQPAPPTPPPPPADPDPVKPVEDTGENIPVTVVPDGYKQSFEVKIDSYVATQDAVIKDFDGKQPDIQMRKGQLVKAGGVFKKEGLTYVRTSKSCAEGYWYGIPLELLEEVADKDLFDLNLANEARELLGNLSGREKFIAGLAKIMGLLQRVLTAVKLKKAK